MTLDTPATDASGGRRDRRTRAASDATLTRSEYRRRAAEAAALAAAQEPAASIVEQVVVETAVTLPLRRRDRSARHAATPVEAPEVPTAPAGQIFLDETIVLPSASSTHIPAAATLVDEFALAAEAFAFTGETPIQVARAAHEGQHVPTSRAGAAALTAPKPRRGRVVFKRVAAASFSVGVVGVVGALAFATTTPVSAVTAFGSAVSGDISIVAPESTNAKSEIQAYVAASDMKASDLVRSESYDIESMADVAADSGVTQFAGTWVNDTGADIQWPFPVGVPISAAYGSTSYLSKFSTPHRGVDLTPGRGAEIHAVAAGTVRIATEGGGDYGVTVVIDHIIDGQLVSTRYGHMEYGSLRVSPGDTVEVGDVIGTVGSTGKATGPHLHLEVLLGGTQRVDPMAWLYEHTD
ncbi:M23 family metallopeptidase [Microbacterium dauci]|uniref:M23 family metallopeptidase n=1 Tax=Microbacterium dauci TaxID=3048008 RepID=A0ABT6ZGB2_9MICO|nr:M23 family metallopeptidase [Microbacterium sp. LX3-4]MDJ1114780.1 M23 family metallopeptidase [Microbacterium sp. LX3-4]